MPVIGGQPGGQIINQQSGPPDLVSVASGWSAAQLAAPYDVYKQRALEHNEAGIILMPVAGASGTAAEAVQVCAAYGLRVVACVARRTGTKPALPPREANSATQVWLRETFTLDTTDQDATGKVQIYQFAVVREYALLQPVGPDDGGSINYGQSPCITSGLAQTTLTASDLDPTQIGEAAWPGQQQFARVL